MRHTGKGESGQRDDAVTLVRASKARHPPPRGPQAKSTPLSGVSTWSKCLEAIGRPRKRHHHHQYRQHSGTASGTIPTSIAATDRSRGSSLGTRSSAGRSSRAGPGCRCGPANNKLPGLPSREFIEMDQVRVRPNLYIGPKPSDFAPAKDGGFGLGLHGIHLPSPTYNPDSPQESRTPEGVKGTVPPQGLGKKSPAVGNMYSRFIEDSNGPHYQPWKSSEDVTQERHGEAYIPMCSGGGGNTQGRGIRRGSLPGSLPGVTPSFLGVITEDQREYPPGEKNTREMGGRKPGGGGNSEVQHEDGGYLQPRPPHDQQGVGTMHHPAPPPSPSDLRLLELIRRARLGSGTDSGVFFGDDFSVSDVGDWLPGLVGTHRSQEQSSPGSRGRHGPSNLRGFTDVDGLHLVVDGNMNGVPSRMPNDPMTDRMRRPDSLAVRGHEYEELPASRYQTRYPYADMEDNSSRSGSGGGRPLPLPMVNELKSGHVHNDSNDSLCRPLSGTSSNGGMQNERISNTYRKRENPLYDDGDTDDLQVKPGRPASLLGCPCSGLILIGLVAVISFLLAVLVMVGAFGGKKEVALSPETAALVEQLNQSDLIAALTNMKRLENQYSLLMAKYNIMETALNLTQLQNGTVTTKVDNNAKAIDLLLSNSGLNLPTAQTLYQKMEHYDKVEQKQNESIADIYYKFDSLRYKLEQLNSSVRQELSSMRDNVSVTDARITHIELNFSRKLATLNSNLTSQIQTVSKMQGPKGDVGPPGVAGAGNLSKCEYSFKRSGSPSASDTATDWWPADTSDMQNWVITGMECTTERGETALMETQAHPAMPEFDQFRCVCRGSISGATSRFCRLNYWRCPRTS